MYAENQNQATEPRTISTDAAKFSLKGFIPEQKRGFRKAPGGINLKYRGYGHHQWQNVVEVFLEGQRIGAMDVHPTTLCAPDTVIWYTDNRIQYERGWTKKVQHVWQSLKLSFRHVCQIDVAVDTPYTDNFNFIQELTAGELKLVGGSAFTVEYTNQAKPRYFRFGSRSSDKYMRAYYKRQELEVSNKKYLEEFWSANGFNLQDNDEVARFEICLKKKELSRYKDIFNRFGDLTGDTLHLLENPEYLAALFNTGKRKFFEFVRAEDLQTDSNVSRAERVEILDLSGITTYLLEKIKTKLQKGIWSAKITVKQLYLCFLKTNDIRYMAQAEDIIYNYHLTRWFTDRCARICKEFEHLMSGDKDPFMSNYQVSENFGQMQIIRQDAYL